MKNYIGKKEYFSLRKFKRGLASVTIGATLFVSVSAADIAINSQYLTVQAATVSDYANFSSSWTLNNEIADSNVVRPSFLGNAYSSAQTTINRNNGTTVTVNAFVEPLSGIKEGMSFLTNGQNQASYNAVANQFAGNPDPSAIPALGIFTQAPNVVTTNLNDVQDKLNYNGSTETAKITYIFSEPVTDPIIDLSGIGGNSELYAPNGGARGSFNNTILELIASDSSAVLKPLTTTNLTVSDKVIKVTDRNTYFRSVLDGLYKNPGTPIQSPRLAPAGTGTVQIVGTVTSVTFKLSHDAVPYSTFSQAEYGTAAAYFDDFYDTYSKGFYTDGINGANKYWNNFQDYGFNEDASNDDLFRMSIRLPDVGDVTVEHQIIDANGNVIGTLEEKSSVKNNETVGVAYTTTPLEGDKLVKDGKTYEYVKVADTSAPTNGEVKTATQQVIYQYREVVKGGEVVEKHVIEGTDTELVTADGTPTAATVKEAGTPLDEDFSTQPKSDLLYDAQGNAYKSNGDTDGKDNNATGKVTADKQTVTFEYVPVKGSVTVDYVDEDGNPIPGVDPKTVKDNEPVTKDGKKYDTTTEDFRPKKVTATDGTEYELVAETPKDGSASSTGTVEEGTKNVTYVYRKVVKTGSVVARYVIEGTETEIADGTIVKPTDTPVDEVYGDTPPATITKDGKKYALVRTRANEGDAPSNGTVVEGKQTITYEYKEVVETPVVKGTEQLTPPPTQPLASDAPKTSVILPKTGTNTSVLALVGLSLLGAVVGTSRRRKEK